MDSIKKTTKNHYQHTSSHLINRTYPQISENSAGFLGQANCITQSYKKSESFIQTKIRYERRDQLQFYQNSQIINILQQEQEVKIYQFDSLSKITKKQPEIINFQFIKQAQNNRYDESLEVSFILEEEEKQKQLQVKIMQNKQYDNSVEFQFIQVEEESQKYLQAKIMQNNQYDECLEASFILVEEEKYKQLQVKIVQKNQYELILKTSFILVDDEAKNQKQLEAKLVQNKRQNKIKKQSSQKLMLLSQPAFVGYYIFVNNYQNSEKVRCQNSVFQQTIFISSMNQSIQSGFIKSPPSQFSQIQIIIPESISYVLPSQRTKLKTKQWFIPCPNDILSQFVGKIQICSNSFGTGFLWKNFIITCAHNLYNYKKNKMRPKPQYFQIASKISDKKTQKLNILRSYIPGCYMNKNLLKSQINYDIALMQIQNLGQTRPEYKILTNIQNIKVNDTILLFGFPSQMGPHLHQTFGEQKLFGNVSKILHIKNGRIWVKWISFMEKNKYEELELIGIHNGFDHQQGYSFGLILNAEKWKYLKFWQCQSQGVIDMIKIDFEKKSKISREEF